MRAPGSRLTISCICRASLTKHTRRKSDGEYCDPMPMDTTDNWITVYNNPENHYAPFEDKDVLR